MTDHREHAERFWREWEPGTWERDDEGTKLLIEAFAAVEREAYRRGQERGHERMREQCALRYEQSFGFSSEPPGFKVNTATWPSVPAMLRDLALDPEPLTDKDG